MLNAISWQQYLTAVILCSAAWYAYVGLRFYQPELQALLKIKPKGQSVMPPVANQMTVVMGQVRTDKDTGLYAPEQLSFGTASPDDISDQTLPKGPADELLAEAETLISAYTENEDKASFIALFKVLLSKYEIFADEISLPAIIKSLDTSKLPFQIQASEWPLSFAS